jgi:hypothetical protein
MTASTKGIPIWYWKDTSIGWMPLWKEKFPLPFNKESIFSEIFFPPFIKPFAFDLICDFGF